MRITQLPSGFWAVWAGNDWIDASSTTREQAEVKAAAYQARIDRIK